MEEVGINPTERKGNRHRCTQKKWKVFGNEGLLFFLNGLDVFVKGWENTVVSVMGISKQGDCKWWFKKRRKLIKPLMIQVGLDDLSKNSRKRYQVFTQVSVLDDRINE